MNLNQAILIATKAHQNQVDKAGKPYILHPIRVMMKMEGEIEQIVAVLHDVLEDCPDYNEESLREEGFSSEVIEALSVLNRSNYPDYQSYIYNIVRNPIARIVKLADLEDNINVLCLNTITEKDFERIKKYHWAHLFLLNQQ